MAQLTYAYDPYGRRISKTVLGGTPTQYLYDGDNAVQETQGSNVNAILTGLGVDERFARTDVTGRTYFLTDVLNSTLALTDATGAIREQYSYDPYGSVTPSDTTTGFTNPYQYTGREADAPALYYYRARYYSPPIGGFISEDPAGFAGGQLSFTAYGGSDPVDNIDPMGLESPRAACGGGPGTAAWAGCAKIPKVKRGCGDYWSNYREFVSQNAINVGPYAAALAGGLWPKSWAPAGGFRPPLLGSQNPLTSVPRGFGVPDAGEPIVQGTAAAIGVATVAVGFYDATIEVEGFIYADDSVPVVDNNGQ